MQPRDAQVYRVPGYPWTLALYLAILAVMTATTCYYYPRSALLNLALVGSGVPFYFVWRKRYKGTKEGSATNV
jgi:hypothetical protein